MTCRASLFQWLLAFACFLIPAISSAQPVNNVLREQGRHGVILVFADADVAAGGGYQPPPDGWDRTALGVGWAPPRRDAAADPHVTMWARMRFVAGDLPEGRIAIYTIDSRERLMVFLNGVDVASNFADDDPLALGGGRPLLTHVSRALLRPGINELVIRAERTKRSEVAFGKVVIGSASELESRYRAQNFWRTSLLTAACYAMLSLGILVILFWLVRREEPELLFLGLSGLFWFARNYQFLADRAFEPFWLYQLLSDASVFLAVGSMLCYCVLKLNLSNQALIIRLCLIIGTGTALAFSTASGYPKLQTAVIVVANACIGLIAWLVVRGWRGATLRQLLPSLWVFGVLIAFAVHDMGRIPALGWWNGVSFLLLPFAGIILFFTFLLASGARLVSALDAVARANAELEARVTQTRSELVASEAARRQLEVDNAVQSERERLMREIHDGIGSNLVAALAIAEKQRHPVESIATLKRSLSDLKLTVDSLEPVEGDIVALMGNMRHRLLPDLAEAGLECHWLVEECRPLAWLDATSALHVMRLFQEAIGNVLQHSGASEVLIGCRESEWRGQAGVSVFVADNGCGFDPGQLTSSGKGLQNMARRADLLRGRLDIERQEEGTILTLWLPLERSGGAR